MLIILLALIASSSSHRVTESVEDLPPEAFNTTALFPVNRTANWTNGTSAASAAGSTSAGTKVNGGATVWKVEAAFGESKLDEKESTQDEKEPSTTTPPPAPQQNKTKNASEEFRPSPHLGTFFESDDFSLEVIPTRATVSDFRPLKKPPTGFVSFPKDNFKSSFFHPPKTGSFNHNQFPYKIESGLATRVKDPWRPADTLDSKPTMEAPMRIPAGSLYKAPDPFKDKPGADDEDFGLTFDDLKENNNIDIKKRVNPWKHLLRLVTAFIPVGLIISALTPNIVTVHSTGPGPDHGYPPNLYRRSDNKLSELAPISEPCRRRLLCELHSENNYNQNPQSSRGRRRHCFRLHCEEHEALAKMLQWLLNHRTGDRKGQPFT